MNGRRRRVILGLYGQLPTQRPPPQVMLYVRNLVCLGGTVTRRLLRLEIPVFPERKIIRVHDPTVNPDSPGSPVVPVNSLISASREQMVVACAQEHLGVQLTVEEWDGAPPPFSDGYEDE